MRSRFDRHRVLISYACAEEPVEATILRSFVDMGESFYRIQLADSDHIIDVPVRSVDWIAHKRCDVIPFKKRFTLVK